jgi:hypothetical protein
MELEKLFCMINRGGRERERERERSTEMYFIVCGSY